MASPGPSRARSGAAAQPSVKLPASIDVEKLALGRRTEIFSMERAMKASRDSGAQRAFQSLPRHLRRRAASHHIRRLPARLRAKAKLEIMHEQAKVFKKKGFRQLPVKKKRKLLRFSRLEILHGRQKTKAWLETHIWHAKRMKMVDVWGYRLAHTPTEKSFRPSYRAAVHGVIVSDTSYYQTIELKGIFESLAAVLASITDAAAVPASATRYSGGIRECQTTLYRHREYPLGAIGPVSVLWDVPAQTVARDKDCDRDPPLRQLLIRFHPAMLDAVSESIRSAIQRFQSDVQAQIEREFEPGAARSVARGAALTKASIGFWHRRLCSFELVGPMTTDAIKSCLRPVNGTSADKMKTWNNLPPPSALPEGTVLALDVYDPRL